MITHKKANYLFQKYSANLLQLIHLTRMCPSDPSKWVQTVCVDSLKPITWREEESKMTLTFLV